uniref:BC026374 protein S09 family n=1 Tax=Echinococcus granulosus TaxID=6210 RepID=A0A068WXJ3_ECHGR|nr:BC026374 protein S09 family [Echinococcus granulosus]
MLDGFVMLRPLGCLAYLGLFLSECLAATDIRTVYVKTVDGTLRGYASTVLQKPIVTFLGIPFATPPVKDLRFKPPIPLKPWKGIRDATKPAPTCIQPLPEKWQKTDPMTRVWLNTTEMSEDCLYLNIWTNAINGSSSSGSSISGSVTSDSDLDTSFNWLRRRSIQPTSNFQQLNGRPVMVWIHGGNFVSGSANLEMYNGAILASEMGVIVVSIQYRLGSLGFLSLGTPGAPGNQGLLDQVEALQWIRRNIIYFGGNPKQVTLFGQGAGALSASLHLLSPVSSHLFQQAILQSGSPLTWWAVESAQSAISKARQFAQLSGCHGSDDEVEACLRSVEAGTLVLNQWKMHLLPDMPLTTREHRISRLYSRRYNPEILGTAGLFFNITFRPVVSEPFLPRWPYQLIGSNREALQHRILLGVNKDEGTYEMIYGLRKYFLAEKNTPTLPKVFSSDHTGMDPLDILAFYIIDEDFLHPLLLQATAFEYQIPSRAFFWKEWTPLQVQHALAEVAGDYNIKCPLLEFADAYSQAPNSQVFLYSFEHQSSGWTWPNWTGVMQAYEAEYIFGAPLNLKFQMDFYKFSDEERKLSASIMQYWANFAATGSPSLHPDEFHTRTKRSHWNNYEIHRTTFKGDLEIDGSREYLVLELPNPRIARNLKRHRCLFWREQLPMLRQRLVPNSRCQMNLTKETELKQVNKPAPQPLPAPQTSNWEVDAFLRITSAAAATRSAMVLLAFACNLPTYFPLQ